MVARTVACPYGEVICDEGLMMGHGHPMRVLPERQPDVRTDRTCSRAPSSATRATTMLTRLAVRNFKLFEEIELDLGQQVVLTGRNNSGKSTVFQALALWDVGLKRWLEKRGAGDIPKRPGVTVNRRDLIALRSSCGATSTPTPAPGTRTEGSGRSTCESRSSSTGLIGHAASNSTTPTKSRSTANGERMPVPEAARDVRVAYLPPMSLAANETRLDQGAINVRLGEGRTAEVLRNLC